MIFFKYNSYTYMHDLIYLLQYMFCFQVLPTLTGQKQKEISFKPGVDGGLVCEIDVVPLNITWTVNGAVINGMTPRAFHS